MMKKCVLATCVLMAFFQTGFATQARISALGNSTAMIIDDDTNIDIFPQAINRQNFMRLKNIQNTQPDYAIITGDDGDKWGLYGGNTQEHDFLNVYRSLGNGAAIKLGAKVGRHSYEETTDNNEASPIKSDEKNTYVDIDLQALYGKTIGERETAFMLRLAKGPKSVTSISFDDPIGSYDFSNTSGGTTTKGSGDFSQTTLAATGYIRQPYQLAMFKKMFAAGTFTYVSDKSKTKSGATTNLDTSGNTIALTGSALFFDEINIAEHSRVFYGLGADATIARITTDKNNAPKSDSTRTILNVNTPQIRLGMESDIKYGKLRFGISRTIDLFTYNSATGKLEAGSSKDENTEKTFDLITNGNYKFAAGYGMEYKNLKIDITLNKDVWVRGPQMLFSSGAGPLGGVADVIYTF